MDCLQMTWGNPPPIEPTEPKQGKVINPEDLAGDSESSQQKALFAWAAQSVGKYPQLAYMFAVPNGFFATIAQKGKMKAEGLRSGVPDIFLLSRAWKGIGYVEGYAGCFIEMKIEKYRNRKDGGCSEEQIDFINYATSAGYYCKVCYNWMEARDTLIAYLEGKL